MVISKHQCQLSVRQYFWPFFIKFCILYKWRMSVSKKQFCFSKAYIISPVKFKHFFNDTFSFAVFILVFWVATSIIGGSSAISCPLNYSLLMHFQILYVQAPHKLRPFQIWRPENSTSSLMHHCRKFIPAIYCAMHSRKLLFSNGAFPWKFIRKIFASD